MKVQFLGTAAAEGWPAVFCKCDACMRARKLGGKNIRTRSSCIIDDVYMVDFSPDTYMHVLTNNLELDRIEHLFITHSHEDHFYPQDIQMRKYPYAHIDSGLPLVIHGNSDVKAGFTAADYEDDQNNSLIFKEVYPFKEFTAKQATVVPLLANHKKSEECYIYLIIINGKTLLYGHDSGYFSEQTWDALKSAHIDAAILDCTHGGDEQVNNHMGFPTVLRTKQRLLEQGSADMDTMFVITHFSHNCRLLHEDLEAMASPHGFITAYDGMELTF